MRLRSLGRRPAMLLGRPVLAAVDRRAEMHAARALERIEGLGDRMSRDLRRSLAADAESASEVLELHGRILARIEAKVDALLAQQSVAAPPRARAQPAQARAAEPPVVGGE